MNMGYLGRACGTQRADKRHLIFYNLVLLRKLLNSVRFVSEKEADGFLQPDKLAHEKVGVLDEIITLVLAGKYPHKKIPSVLIVGIQRKYYFNSFGNYEGCGQIDCAEMFGEFGPWRYRNGKIYRGGF